MKNLLLLLISFSITILSTSCKEKKGEETNSISYNSTYPTDDSIGHQLLVKNCYICHMPQNMDQMIAPPLFRVKEHYLPIYNEKQEFVDAVVNWAKNPSEEKSIMPGAVRQFNCMPPQSHIPDDTLSRIAAYIYNNDLEKPEWFDEMHVGNGNGNGRGNGMRMQQSDSIDQKTKLDGESIVTIDKASKLLGSFKGKTVEDYQKLGKEFFDITKQILLNKNNTGTTWDQLHNFFNNMEADMHSLMAVKTVEEGKQLKENLERKLGNFSKRFE